MICPTAPFFAQDNGSKPEYSLYQNSPNPFGETTTIKFSLKEDCSVKLYITEHQTGKTSMLADGEMTAGEHGIIFKTMSKTGSSSENYTDYTCTMETYTIAGDILLYSSRIKMVQK